MYSTEEKLLKELSTDDLQEQHRQFAEAVGMEGLLKLVEAFGGSSIYIPQKRELLKNKTYNSISKEFDGANIKTLANKYKVSESTVYNIVREQILKGTAKQQLPGQISIMDLGI
ncbi:MAG: Mor transcription activator family protein [Lachnospiraceae bacterium]|nr:Mor transcription activator family protein [Lachnospiraceae bacterium]